MNANEKLQAVEDYLLREFRDAKIEIKSNAVEQTHRFQILHQGKSHCTIVVEAFLQGCETEQIATTLEDFMLAEHLREMGMMPVVVAPEGLKLEGD